MFDHFLPLNDCRFGIWIRTFTHHVVNDIEVSSSMVPSRFLNQFGSKGSCSSCCRTFSSSMASVLVMDHISARQKQSAMILLLLLLLFSLFFTFCNVAEKIIESTDRSRSLIAKGYHLVVPTGTLVSKK